MMAFFEAAAARALRALDPERAHRLAVAVLRMAPLPASTVDDPRLAVSAFGLRFGNPVGLAAGFDKKGEIAVATAKLGFGFTEIGTVTPLAQAGNARPRVFRLPGDAAVINRYGFNNDGHAAVHARLIGRPPMAPLGVNLGANKDAPDRTADYVAGIARFADVADYFVLNVSSPNTPGLRDLQAAAALDDLLARAVEARDRAAARRPLLLKIAPDLDLAGLDDIVAAARARHIDGLIVSNTTVARPASLRDPAAREAGGLSGRPLFDPSTRVLAQAFLRVEGQFPLVGVGGIDGGEAAFAKIRAGASLVQLYSGLVYRGIGLVAEIKHDLLGRLDGKSLAEHVGVDAAVWAQV